MSACIAQPISWLELERYELGELPATRRSAIDVHVAQCPACASCLQHIQQASVSLPPLPAAPPEPSRHRWRAWMWGAPAVLALAGLLLVVVPRVPKISARSAARGGAVRPGSPTLPVAPAVKGGEMALTLVRRRDGHVVEGASTFAATDRFEALVTCPQARPVWWDLVVYQGSSASFPLQAEAPLSCGNQVSLPGAFRIAGSAPARVCVVIGAAAVDRDALAAAPPTGGEANVACVVVQPAPPRR